MPKVTTQTKGRGEASLGREEEKQRECTIIGIVCHVQAIQSIQGAPPLGKQPELIPDRNEPATTTKEQHRGASKN